MEKFTKLQREEILSLIEIREDSISEDASNADTFESIEGNLIKLRHKIENGIYDFTEDEIRWLTDELETRQNVGFGNRSNEGVKVNGFINTMQNAIDKLNG